ncbi:MAG: class I SAM-dependent methyltransferase [Lachnospiraceae bacterium]|nr:class I SAM-dependent methyltransferase [Lachnospiraceae bacterium]
MDAYTIFAEIYDEFMGNIPYEKWCDNIHGILSDNGIDGGIVAELGCGTGTVTRLMSDKGYEMIGIDNSEDMLSAAGEENDGSILYLLQDMRELELYGTVAAVISLCDSMNYLVNDGELEAVLRKANLYLEKGGLFIFDMKTAYCYESILADSVQYEYNEECALIWENHFDKESSMHTYELTIFMACDEGDDGGPLYERFLETHFQRAYSVDEVKRAIDSSGMELVGIIDADTLSEPSDTSQRLYYIVRETYQDNKYYMES